MTGRRRTMARDRLLLVAAMTCTLLAPTAATCQQIHGENSSFVGYGVALVWGVLRGPREDDTQVVLRAALAGGEYVAIGMEGVDPFTQRREDFLVMQALGERLDIRTPRSTFADFPRREIHFYTATDRDARRPSLTVYFMGLPDTTPEFATEAALVRYFNETIAPLSSTKGHTP